MQKNKLAPIMVENMPSVTSHGVVSDGAIGVFKLIASGLFEYTNTWATSINDRRIDVSHLDNNTTDKILELTETILDISSGVGIGGFVETFTRDSYRYNKIFQMPKIQRVNLTNSITATINIWNLDTAVKICDSLILVHCDNNRVRSIYMDFCSMVEQLNMQSRIKPYFKDSAELEMMHDELSSLIDATEDEVNMDAWERIKDNWEKWEFSDDDDFIVTAPQKPYDVAHEGINLHHCVKSYIPKIIARTTNIMFIRKKYSPDTPFFTVEITNNNVIQQVHGSCNRNTSTEPGLDDFISKWQKACGLSNFGYDKIR